MRFSNPDCRFPPEGPGPGTAWMRTRGKVAIVCAWCPDLKIAEKRARAAGLLVSHGICPECAARQSGRDVTPDSFAEILPFPPDRPRASTVASVRGKYSCAVGSATGGERPATFSPGSQNRGDLSERDGADGDAARE